MVGRSLLMICGVLLLAGGPAAAFDDVGRSERLSLARVESRQLVYGEKLSHWRDLGERTANPSLAARRPAEWAGCFAAVENLARSYGRLKEDVARRNGAGDHEVAAVPAAWSVIFDDIAFLEGGCGQVYQQVSGLVAGGETRAVASGQPNSVVQRPPLGEQEQFEKWNKAVGLFDSGNYDEAISELDGLLNTPQAEPAKEKIREAQTLVATQLRRQAAGVLARKTDDPAQKKKLLEESWALLNKIIISYPEATILDKVKQNLAQIESQLAQLDPALLLRLKSGATN